MASIAIITDTINSNSILVRAVGLHGIIHVRCDSPIGRNAFGVTQSELLSGRRIDEFICTGHSLLRR